MIVQTPLLPNDNHAIDSGYASSTSTVIIRAGQAIPPGTRLLVIGIDGKIVADLSTRLVNRKIIWNAGRITTGVYSVRLNTGRNIYTKSIVTVR